MLVIFLHILGLLLNAPGFLEHSKVKQEVAFEALLEYETNKNLFPKPQRCPDCVMHIANQ